MQERLIPFYEAASKEAAEYEETESLKGLEEKIEELGNIPSLIYRLSKDDDVSVIAEHKRRSPSEGDIRPGSSVAWTVEQYRQGGAAALSILTQQEHFGGRPEDLLEARSVTDLPILRKDFISNEYQLYQARSLGASAALLIVGGLEQDRFRSLYKEASGIGLECLVEVHNKEELDRAMELPPSLLGINNRDLTNMKVNLQTTHELIEDVPGDMPVIAESGYSVRKPEHIKELKEMKVSGVLMGTALMREPDPAQALSNWLAN